MTAPRSEYPRPDFVRRAWQCLNGEWEFAFDDRDIGLRDGWFEEDIRLPERIVVPFAYQSQLSGIGDRSIHEVVWYAHEFEVSNGWQDNDLLLHFGAVDYVTTVWINGKEAARNRGGHVPFSLDVTPYLRTGTNRIVLRVEDRQDPRQPRGKQSVSGKSQGVDYYCTTGIWQTVWLEPVPKLRIDTVRVRSHLNWRRGDDTFEVSVILHSPAIGWEVEVEVRDGGQIIAKEREEGGATFRLFIEIPNAKRWTPEEPFLYDFTLRLHDREGELQDEVTTYAGMRSIKVRGGDILLNDQPIYLAMALDQGYWPDGNMTAASDEVLRRDVELAKAMGFNGVRKHQKVEDPRWLYWCDKLGLLVWGEMANARKWSIESEEEFVAEWERVVRRDANHPCIITWVPVNESWGVPGLRSEHPAQYSFLERVVALTRRLDPSRPVIDNDGWEHTDVSDIAAIHDYTPTGSQIVDRWQNGMPEKIWHKNLLVHFLKGAQHRGQPVVLSEVGGLLMIPKDVQELDRLYNVYASIQTEEELLDRYRELIHGIALISGVRGFCYTQLTDVEQEINGLLTYDRKIKVPLEEIAKINQEAVKAALDALGRSQGS